MDDTDRKSDVDEGEGNDKVDNEQGVPRDGSSFGMDPILNAKLSATFLLCSRRNSGKSTFLSSLVYGWLKMGRFRSQNVIVFSATCSMNDEYSWLPPENVRHGWDEVLVRKLIQFQRRRILLKKKQATRANVSVHLPGLLLILDDIVGQRGIDVAHSPVLKWLMCSGRHAKISVAIASQLSRVICNPTVRSQSDYVLTSSLSADQLDSVWRITSGKSWREFKDDVSALEDYTWIMYDSVVAKGNRWYTMKAALPPKFRVTFRNHKKPGKKKKDEAKKS